MTRLCLVVCLSAGLLLSGCAEQGPQLGAVSGTVTLEGEPVEGATISFFPLFEGGQELRSAQKTDSSGFYEMQYSQDRKGVMLGNHQVQISTKDWEKQPDGSNKIIPERIPRHYFGPDSVLTFDVQEGENDASFELSKKKPK